jgi:TetR/AcrR family fatty acid metabolism transcriptional regulator
VTRRRREPEIREEAILRAAHLEFCKQGYDGATISSIARRANVADGTIYKYVADKRELLFRVLAKAIEGHVDETVRLAEQLGGAAEKLEYFCYRHLLFWDQNRKLSLLYAAESRTRDRQHWPTYRDVNRKYVHLVQKAIEEGIASGEFNPSMPTKFVRDVIIGSVEQVAWSLTSGDKVIEPHRMARDIVQIFLHGIGSQGSRAGPEDLAGRLERAIEKLERRAEEHRTVD